MYLALETFRDPTDGGLITAGQTRVSGDAAVFRLYPSRFALDAARTGGVRGLTRGGGTAAIDRPRRSPTTLPKLYAELEHPGDGVELGYFVAEQIRRDISWSKARLGADFETGGWLFAAATNRNYIVRASVPGTDAIPARGSISLGFKQAEAIKRIYPDLHIVGDHHYHPGGDDVPSDTDLRGWAQGAKLAGGRWVSLIMVPSRTWRGEPEIHGWVTFGPRSDLLITERLPVVT